MVGPGDPAPVGRERGVERVSDVAQGPGWWQASDGRWYPPETHPSARSADRPPTAPPPLPPMRGPGPGPAAGGHGTGRSPSAAPSRAWGDDYWTSMSATTTLRRSAGGSRPGAGLRRAVDRRGAFVTVCSLLLLLGCTLPYYRVTATGSGVLSSPLLYKVVDSAFGSWRAGIPVLAIAAALVGIVNSLLRVGAPGAVGVLAALRLMALGQLGLWVLVAVAHTPGNTTFGVGALGTSPTVSVTWVAWAAVATAAAALAGSFASMGRAVTS
jgi:hypothetical protein